MAFYNAHIHRAKFAIIHFNIVAYQIIFPDQVNQISGMYIDFLLFGRFNKPETFGSIEKLYGSFLHINVEDEVVVSFGFYNLTLPGKNSLL